MTTVALLDGSIGQHLVKLSGDRPTPLWSTQAMIDHPAHLRAVHDAYFAAGATIATTNTYAVLRDRLIRAGLDHLMEELAGTALEAARAARDANGSGRLAGALGPLVASYRPDICPPAAEAARIYAEPVRLMKDRVDLLMIETMSSVDQADGALRAASGQGLPVWLSVTVRDDDGTRLRSGESLAELAPLVDRHAPAAVLVNCSPPEAIGDALEVIRGFDRPFGAYANGFARISEGFLKDAPTVDALERRTDVDPETYAGFALDWVAQGATIVGGCCEIGPDHIAAVAGRLRAGGHEIV